jgi:hypothetical protein
MGRGGLVEYAVPVSLGAAAFCADGIIVPNYKPTRA